MARPSNQEKSHPSTGAADGLGDELFESFTARAPPGQGAACLP